MIVRESPRKGRSGVDPAWPPRSPGQAALSSPSGRRRIEALIQQRRQRDGSTSPSPSRPHSAAVVGSATVGDDEDEGDEDEETLQLKLQRIEAQLKLKRLRKARENVEPARQPRLGGEEVVRTRLEVPASPRKSEPVLPASPRRVQLGIDKGLKASDVSLKRPASTRRARNDEDDYIRPREPARAPVSFSERLAQARMADKEKEQRQANFKDKRSSGFGLFGPPKTSGSKGRQTQTNANNTAIQADSQDSNELFQHHSHKPSASNSDAPEAGQDPFSGIDLSKRVIEHSTLDKAFSDKDLFRLPQILKQVTAPDYEPPDVENDYVILAAIASKSTPRDQAVAHKSSSTGDADDSANQRKKFMVMHLTDLKWELDLFLFDAAFDAFWKLTVGSVIAILNPGIMPPKPHMRNSGQFSLKLACSEDALIEIGTAKYLGWCKSTKKDGDKCGQWVDTRKTDFCDFHVNLQIEKTRASRPEVNSMAGLEMFGKKQAGNGNTRYGSSFGAFNKAKRQAAKTGVGKKPQIFDWEARNETSFTFSGGTRLNTAKLLDAEDYAHGENKHERDIRRAQQRKSERKLLAQLGASGTGQGGEYARLRRDRSETGTALERNADSASNSRSKADLQALGLGGGSAAAVKLSPIKGGKYKGLSSSGEQMGWGGAYKRGLLEPTRGSSPVRKALKSSANSEAPSKGASPSKQARFKLPDKKGLRLPGRDSLPTDSRVHDDYDDDDLDILL